MRAGVAIAIAAFLALGSLSTVAAVGKPRPPLTGTVAVWVVIVSGLMGWGVLWLAFG